MYSVDYMHSFRMNTKTAVSVTVQSSPCFRNKDSHWNGSLWMATALCTHRGRHWGGRRGKMDFVVLVR